MINMYQKEEKKQGKEGEIRKTNEKWKKIPKKNKAKEQIFFFFFPITIPCRKSVLHFNKILQNMNGRKERKFLEINEISN